MATGLEGWLFGYAGKKLADKALEIIRGDRLTAELHAAVDQWASQLPSSAALESSYALFPGYVSEEELAERPHLLNLRRRFSRSMIPTDEDWLLALIEQWDTVRANVTHPQNLFLLSADEARDHLRALSVRMATVCAQHEPLFRATTIALLRELLADDAASVPTRISDTLSEDQKYLLRLLYRHKGLCRISAPPGEYKCLWVPGPVTEIQKGWERTPEECALSGKEPGDRGERLHWIYVVEDLAAAGIFEAQDDGYFELTKKGRRVAHNLSNDTDVAEE